jgi:penicillin-binding protein 2
MIKTKHLFLGEYLLIFFCVIFFSLLLVRLVDLQIVHGEKYQKLAQANRTLQDRLPPERGIFLDRYEQPMVRNTKTYFLRESTQESGDAERRISHNEALGVLATRSADLRYELERYYPFANSLAPVLGYTGLVTAENLLENPRLHPRDRVGKLGLEKMFDTIVLGSAGSSEYEVNALGKRLRPLDKKLSTSGATVHTTLDPYISEIASRLLEEKKGAVVVLNAKNGEVLSLVSAPSFSASDISTSSTDSELEQARQKRVQGYFSDPNQVFFNRASSGMYPPGSVFKLVTAAAGLEEEAIDKQYSVLDEGVLKVGDFSYANWYYTQHGGTDGEIRVVRALARSNDIFFYKTAELLGPFQLATMARSFGFGEPTGIELTSEAAGVVPDPDWKQKTLGEQWYLGNTYHFGIGQGDVLVTPLQVAQMTQAVANRGTLCAPHLLIEQNSSPLKQIGAPCRELGIQEKNLEIVLEGMLDACSSGGTAFPFFPYNEKKRVAEFAPYVQLEQGAVACKTGTAEFGGQDARGYRKTHGWFTMAVGVDVSALAGGTGGQNVATTLDSTATQEELHAAWLQQLQTHNFPQELVITVLVESDEATPYREGSRDAAPVARALVEWMQTGNTQGVVEAAKAAPYQGE